jgi:hypothetical protein
MIESYDKQLSESRERMESMESGRNMAFEK